MQLRGQLLVDYEVPTVTRQLASAGAGLHPLVCLLEEAHVAITHHRYGKDISGLLVDVVKLGRKRGIHLIVSTQAPTKDSMPRDVTRNCSNGIAYEVQALPGHRRACTIWPLVRIICGITTSSVSSPRSRARPRRRRGKPRGARSLALI